MTENENGFGDAASHGSVFRVIFELRTYHCEPAHVDRFIERCRTQTLPLWREHDVHLVGFWRTMIGSTMDVVYMLAWRDLHHYETAWRAFQSDERWLRIKSESEAETGQWVWGIDTTFLSPEEFSPLGGKNGWSTVPEPGI